MHQFGDGSLPFGISIDLRAARLESERQGVIADYALQATDLDRAVRDVLERQQITVHYRVGVVPAPAAFAPTKNAPQIIDLVTVALGPLAALGVAGCVKLVVQLIEACRTKIPTTYEVERDGIKVKISGPSISPDDVKQLRDMFRDLLDSPAPRLLSQDAEPIRVKALPRDE
jgi:hypothetical protein